MSREDILRIISRYNQRKAFDYMTSDEIDLLLEQQALFQQIHERLR